MQRNGLGGSTDTTITHFIKIKSIIHLFSVEIDNLIAEIVPEKETELHFVFKTII